MTKEERDEIDQKIKFERRISMYADKNQEKIYVPLIESFKKQTSDLYKKLWISKSSDIDLSGLFIPHVFEDYYKARKKIFYIGQDTYYWTPLSNVYNLTETEYLMKNNDWPESIDKTLEWTRPYDFWNFVNRLHLVLNDEECDNLQNLGASQRSILNQIGWGNIYSLETFKTIKKYGEDVSNAFDNSVYSIMFEEAKKVSSLNHVIEAFNPDYIVILAWQDVEEWYFKGLNVRYIAEKSIENLLSVYEIENSGKKILWTYHPNALRFKGQDLGGLTNILKDRL